MYYSKIIDMYVCYLNEQRVEAELKSIKKYQCLMRSVKKSNKNELICV